MLPEDSPSSRQLVLNIIGMKCDDCVRRVAEAILGVEGVDDAEVDLERAAAEVTLTEQESATREAIEGAVREAGFQVGRIGQAM